MPLSRREFLRAAGGTTLLALVPQSCARSDSSGAAQHFSAPRASALRAAPPLFTVLPYVQPGNASRLQKNEDTRVIAWQTVAKPGDFQVQFGTSPRLNRRATIARHAATAGASGEEPRFLYAAQLDNLPLAKKVFYRVSCNGAVLLEGYFTTRVARRRNIRFAAFGDNSWGGRPDNEIAYQAWRSNPDFVMNTGDNVYDGGTLGEYERYFFPAYNAASASPHKGAPLLRSVPFYSVIANHDVRRRIEGREVANFDRDADSLGYYRALHLPLNGPIPAHPTPIAGDAARLRSFKTEVGDKFPRMANYSFDWGDAHFCCLDSNLYTDPTNAQLHAWIKRDLTQTNALWKFVVFHHPPFNVGEEHYRNQQMRVLAPLFEQCGVDVALHGHEHTYQRPRPLKFAPSDATRAQTLHSQDRRVPGTFQVDRSFDGARQTKPDGVLYITTGAGGASLYDRDWNNNPERWRHADDNNADYVCKFISDRHSFTLFDINSAKLLMRQIDSRGIEIDRIVVTKR